MMQQTFYLLGQLWTTETPGTEGAQFSISIKKKGGGRACQHSRNWRKVRGHSRSSTFRLLQQKKAAQTPATVPGCHSPTHLVCSLHGGELIQLTQVSLSQNLEIMCKQQNQTEDCVPFYTCYNPVKKTAKVLNESDSQRRMNKHKYSVYVCVQLLDHIHRLEVSQ